MATGYTPPGATCCCGGAVCGCPEPQPSTMCAVVTGVTGVCGCDPVAEVTLTRGDPPFADYLWSGYADLTGCTPTVRMTVTVSCADGPPGAFNVQVQFGQTAAPFGVCAYSNDSIFVGDGGAGCDPFFIDTAAGGNAWAEGGSGLCSCFPDAASIAVTVSAGSCGEALMAGPRLLTATATAAPARGYRPPPPARPRICLYAERVEFRAGCSGFRCQHRCTSPDPGVRAALGDTDIVLPADECQTCSGYTAR